MTLRYRPIMAFAAIYTIGLFALLVSLAGIGLSDGFHYPMTRLLLLGGVYAVISHLAISHSFGHPMGLAPETASDPSRDLMPVPVKVTDTYLDR